MQVANYCFVLSIHLFRNINLCCCCFHQILLFKGKCVYTLIEPLIHLPHCSVFVYVCVCVCVCVGVCVCVLDKQFLFLDQISTVTVCMALKRVQTIQVKDIVLLNHKPYQLSELQQLDFDCLNILGPRSCQ